MKIFCLNFDIFYIFLYKNQNNINYFLTLP